MRRIKEVATAPGNWPVIVKLIIFSCMMLILPLASYSLAQSYMSVNYAALLSILVVQVIIILYVIMAFTEEDAGRDESERGQLHNSATRPKQN